MMALRVLLSLLLSLPSLVYAQGVTPVHPVNPAGARLLPNPLADADAMVNETATAIRGKCYLYNGTSWDRCRGTIAGGLLVNISNATLAVTQSGTWNIGSITTLPSLPTGANTIGAINQAGTWTVQPGNTANTTPWLVNEFSSAALLAGQQAVTATATALATNTIKEVCVKALLANTINVYVGPSGVTTGTGLELGPGDSYCTRMTNTNALFVIASGAGPSISWAARN